LEHNIFNNNSFYLLKEILSQGYELADKIAVSVGGWKFVVWFLIVIVPWLGCNVIAIGKKEEYLKKENQASGKKCISAFFTKAKLKS